MGKLTVQDFASYAAVIVASVALYVGWDQARIGRNQQHADVFPVVQLRSQYTTLTREGGDRVRHLSLKAVNAGVGPAFVMSTYWKIGTHTINQVSEIHTLFPEQLKPVDYYFGAHQNFLLAAGAEATIWEVYWDTSEQSRLLIDDFLNKFWNMHLSMCYCSLYNRCWVANSSAKSPMPEEAEQCSVPLEVKVI